MSDEDKNEILKAQNFATIKKLALDAPDFTGRVKAVLAQKIDKTTVGALVETTNTYTAENKEQIEHLFADAFSHMANFKTVKEKIIKHSQGDDYYLPLWVHNEAAFVSYNLAYQKAAQALGLLMTVNVQLVGALLNVYAGSALSVSEKEAIHEAAKSLKAIAGSLEGMDALHRQKDKVKDDA